MATVRKFTFDTHFDDPHSGRPTLGQALAGDGGASTGRSSMPPPPPEPEPEPDPEPEDLGPPLVYTEEDMEIAREEAYVAGHTAALDDASVQAENAVAEAMVEAGHALRRLGQGVVEAHEAYGDLAARVAAEICRTLLPVTAEEYALAEISALVRTLLPNLIGQPRLIVRAHPEVRGALHRALTLTAEQAGFEGRLTVIGDETLTLSDCRLEWPDGGAERNTTRLWADIDALLERNVPLFRRGEALEVEEEEPEPEPTPEPENVWPEDVDTAAHYRWVPPSPVPDAAAKAEAEVEIVAPETSEAPEPPTDTPPEEAVDDTRRTADTATPPEDGETPEEDDVPEHEDDANVLGDQDMSRESPDEPEAPDGDPEIETVRRVERDG